MDKAKQILLPANRQYRHNNSDGFLMGYEAKETERIVTGLLDKKKFLETCLARCLTESIFIKREPKETISITFTLQGRQDGKWKDITHARMLSHKDAKILLKEYRESLEEIPLEMLWTEFRLVRDERVVFEGDR